MRLVHVYLQHDQNFKADKTFHSVGNKRIVIAVLSIVLLLMYFVLAAETTVLESNLLLQKGVFAIGTFFIWYLSDVFFETVGVWRVQEKDKHWQLTTQVERFWDHLRKKNAITVTIILLTVIVMSMLCANTVCAAAKYGNHRTLTGTSSLRIPALCVRVCIPNTPLSFARATAASGRSLRSRWSSIAQTNTQLLCSFLVCVCSFTMQVPRTAMHTSIS